MQVLSSQAATCVCELAALPALGTDILDKTVLWHAVAGLNLLSPEVADSLTNDSRSESDSREGPIYCR